MHAFILIVYSLIFLDVFLQWLESAVSRYNVKNETLSTHIIESCPMYQYTKP